MIIPARIIAIRMTMRWPFEIKLLIRDYVRRIVFQVWGA